METKQLTANNMDEKKKWSMKFFDYDENPIKSWISEYLQEDIDFIFNDYKDEVDIISTNYNNEYYTFYFSNISNESSPNFDISEEDFKNSTKLRQATSILYDAANTVYVPIIKTMSNMSHRMENIFLEFVEKNMYFRFIMINNLLLKKNFYIRSLQQLEVEISKKNENYNKLLTDREKLFIEINNINDIDIKALDEECKIVNNKLENGPFLYIHASKNEEIKKELKYKRLPEFGLKYQDPDEDNYIDIIKKEYDIH